MQPDQVAIVVSQGHDRELKEGAPDVVQTDVVLVTDTWQALVAAVAEQTAKLDGHIMPKVKAVDGAALQAIRTSEQVEQMCEVFQDYDRACSSRISLNPIAFREDVYGSSWDELDDTPEIIRDSHVINQEST